MHWPHAGITSTNPRAAESAPPHATESAPLRAVARTGSMSLEAW